MKSHILSLSLLLIMAGCLLASCLNKNDETTLSSTCYISSVSLGNVKRILYTTDSLGRDSAYMGTYSASSYFFSIDQRNRVITNTEPLLHNSILSSVLCTITASGTVAYRQVSDNPNDELNQNTEWKTYSSTDSMDISKPLILRVVSNDGKSMRDYTFNVTVYSNSPDSLTWTKVADCPLLADFVEQRAQFADGVLTVTGRKQSGECFSIRPLDANPALTPSAPLDLLHTGNAFIDKVIDNRNYGIDPDCLPNRALSGAEYTNDYLVTRYVLVGLRDASFADTCAVVWTGVEGTNHMMFNRINKNFNVLPALRDLQVVAHDGRFVAMGLEALYGSPRKALNTLYVSRDYGATWDSGTAWQVPAALQGRTQPLAVADATQQVYVISGTQVWTMKSNKK